MNRHICFVMITLFSLVSPLHAAGPPAPSSRSAAVATSAPVQSAAPKAPPSSLCQESLLSGECDRLRSFVTVSVTLAMKPSQGAVLAAQQQCREYQQEYAPFAERGAGIARAKSGNKEVDALNTGHFSTADPGLEQGNLFCTALLDSTQSLDPAVCKGSIAVGDGISFGIALETARKTLKSQAAPACRSAESERQTAALSAVGSAPQRVELGPKIEPTRPSTSTVHHEAIRPPWKRPVRIALAVGLFAATLGLAISGALDLAQGRGIELALREQQSSRTKTPLEVQGLMESEQAVYTKGGIQAAVAGLTLIGGGIVLGVDFTRAF